MRKKIFTGGFLILFSIFLLKDSSPVVNAASAVDKSQRKLCGGKREQEFDYVCD